MRIAAATCRISSSSRYGRRVQARLRLKRRSSLRRGTTWIWRCGTLWLTTLLIATNAPSPPVAWGTARVRRLHQGEEWSHLGDGQIGKGSDMRPRNEQNVAGQQRAAIEKCDPRWIVEDDLGRRIAADDGAEDTRATARAVARLALDVEDHDGPCTPFSRMASRYSP